MPAYSDYRLQIEVLESGRLIAHYHGPRGWWAVLAIAGVLLFAGLAAFGGLTTFIAMGQAEYFWGAFWLLGTVWLLIVLARLISVGVRDLSHSVRLEISESVYRIDDKVWFRTRSVEGEVADLQGIEVIAFTERHAEEPGYHVTLRVGRAGFDSILMSYHDNSRAALDLQRDICRHIAVRSLGFDPTKLYRLNVWGRLVE